VSRKFEDGATIFHSRLVRSDLALDPRLVPSLSRQKNSSTEDINRAISARLPAVKNRPVSLVLSGF
jgi:hypothetical protein